MASVRTVVLNIIGNERVSRAARAAREEIEGVDDASSRLGRTLEKLDRAGNIAVFASLAAGAVNLVRALGPATAAVAALPAALGAAAVATKTLQVGLTGVGDAMSAVAEGDAEKLNEALKELAPSAQAFVKQTAALKDEWDDLTRAVQQDLFSGLDKQLASVAKNLLPTVKTGMQEVAGEFNRIALEAAKTARSPWFRGEVSKVFAGTTKATRTLSGAVRPLIELVTRLTVAGMPLVQRMAEWATGAVKSVNAFVRAKDESGQLDAAVSKVGDQLASLGRTISNVVRALGNLIAQTRSYDESGTNLLATLEQLSQRMLEWTQQPSTQSGVAETWRILGDVGRHLLVILPVLTGAIGIIATALAAVPAPVREAVVQMLAWTVVIGFVASRLRLLVAAAAGIRAVTTAVKGATTVISGLRTAGGVVTGFVAGLRNVNLAFAAGASRATVLGAAIRSQIMLWRQQAAAAGVSTARIILNAAAQRVAATATKLWAVAQRLLNAALRANPIMLVVTAVGLLAAGLVIAYRRSETFRGIVQSAWSGIQSAASTAWRFLQGVLSGIWGFITSKVIPVFQDVWAVALKVWAGIGAAVRIAWSIIQPIFNFISGIIFGVLRVAFIILLNTVKTVWIAIQIIIKVGWAVIKGIFVLIKAFITNILGPAFRWLYNNSVKPGWDKIRSAISAAWRFIQPIWQKVRSWLADILASAFRTLRSAGSEAMDRLRSIVSTVWNSGIKPAFDKLRDGLSKVKSAFGTAVEGIRTVWNKLQDIAKKPVNFVIGLYNEGIVDLVNKIASFAGIKTRLTKIPKFAAGGIMPGYAPGRDRLLAAVSPGESIFRPEFTRAVGARWVYEANRIARRHGPSAVRRWLIGGGRRLGGEGINFARGGTVSGFAGAFGLGGIVNGFVRGLRDFAFGNVEKAFRKVLDKIMGNIPGSGVFRDVIAALPKKLIDTLVSWFKDKVGMGGGPSFRRALAFAKAQAGKPYSWGGVGPNGYDCSGFMSAILNVIEGKNPYQRRFTTFSFTGAQQGPAGFVRNRRSAFEVGVTNAGVGHMAGTLLGTNVESRGSAGVVVGARARGAADALFSMRYGLNRDSGGPLPPGRWLVENNTGKTEWIFTSEQLQALAAGAPPAGGSRTVRPPVGERVIRPDRPRLLGPTPAPLSEAQKAFKQLLDQLTKGALTSAEAIADYMAKLREQITKHFSGARQQRLLAWADRLQQQMTNAANQAKAIADRIAQAREYAASVADSARQFAALSGLEEKSSLADIVTGLQERAQQITEFTGLIDALRGRGLSMGLLRQIIDMGAGEGAALARTLLGADRATLKAINDAQAAIDRSATRLGDVAADALYDAGRGAARGFLTGLLDEQARLNALMDQLGRKLTERLEGLYASLPAYPGMGATPKPKTQKQPKTLQPKALVPVVAGRTAVADAAVLTTASAAARKEVHLHFEQVVLRDQADINMLMNTAAFYARAAEF